MTNLNSENSELRTALELIGRLNITVLTIDELDSVSGGRMKIPGKIVTEAEIAKLAADNPGFV